MNLAIKNKVQEIIENFSNLTIDEFAFGDVEEQKLKADKFHEFIKQQAKELDPIHQDRLLKEFFSLGPLEILLDDDTVTEILVNGPDAIWVERKGKLHRHEDQFYSSFTYEQFVLKISEVSKCQLNLETPVIDGKYLDFRLCVVDKSITQNETILSFRKHPKFTWTFAKLIQAGWCSETEFLQIQEIIQTKKNFLVIGTTGCGKTSVVNSILQSTAENERSVIIEDTPEIAIPNSSSIKLLTRNENHSPLTEITQNDLLKKALRLRPDRIVIGEMRGSEAKDFLMALSTGHGGSFGTLHASDPHQALIRLEMLIQIGAPQWSLTAIRKLIFLSLDAIIVLSKQACGKRVLKGIHKITSLEENGFLLESI